MPGANGYAIRSTQYSLPCVAQRARIKAPERKRGDEVKERDRLPFCKREAWLENPGASPSRRGRRPFRLHASVIDPPSASYNSRPRRRSVPCSTADCDRLPPYKPVVLWARPGPLVAVLSVSTAAPEGRVRSRGEAGATTCGFLLRTETLLRETAGLPRRAQCPRVPRSVAP